MRGLETIKKMNKVPPGTIVNVYTHCVEFVCPRCVSQIVGEGYVIHCGGVPYVKCPNCNKTFKANQIPL